MSYMYAKQHLPVLTSAPLQTSRYICVKSCFKDDMRTFGVFEWRVERGSLTQLGGLAKNKGVGPEFGDGGGVENGVAHRLSEAGGCDDVQHVGSSPQSSDDTAE